MKSIKKRKMVDVIVEGFLAEHVVRKDGFAVNSKAAYDLFAEWTAGSIGLTFREFVAAVRNAGVIVRSKGFGLLLIGRRWTPSAHSVERDLKVYRVPTEIDRDRTNEWRERHQYKSQTELGKSLGVSRVQVGRILVAAGLKDSATLTPLAPALTKGMAILAKSYGTKDFYLWHQDVLPTLHQLKATVIPNPLATIDCPLTPLSLGRAD